MPLNESIGMLIEQGAEEIALANTSFGLKLLAIFGVIYLFNVVFKTGISFVNTLTYVYAFFKWIYYKIKKRDI